MWNNAQKSVFLDLFMKSKACLSTHIKIARYVSFTHRNLDNYDYDKLNENNITAGVNENDDNENMKGPLDNLYKLYSMYN